jgi:hypothetical protein
MDSVPARNIIRGASLVRCLISVRRGRRQAASVRDDWGLSFFDAYVRLLPVGERTLDRKVQTAPAEHAKHQFHAVSWREIALRSCRIGRCSIKGAVAAAGPCCRVLWIEPKGTINSLCRVLPVASLLQDEVGHRGLDTCGQLHREESSPDTLLQGRAAGRTPVEGRRRVRVNPTKRAPSTSLLYEKIGRYTCCCRSHLRTEWSFM